ncbi:hypothetical protein O9G_005019 [Rozella allomycis CSF55]|uniref:Uncharacterized protein n=1 Tax=Rozella allomycis (strain CSF55) TaxID=988480 RepID=A0A075B196_ROZAC|nr:hypothetical protein O9G_005019 [Rozella allomycis CSF55]|eukprot:EPZ36118.1 hypothetical protein O9G_005019 [Rozella allomycis CSF55]
MDNENENETKKLKVLEEFVGFEFDELPTGLTICVNAEISELRGVEYDAVILHGAGFQLDL